MKKCLLASIFITVLSMVLLFPAFVAAQSNDYWRQQQQMQQEQQRRWQQQQDDMRRQAAERERQRQIEIERQRQVERQRQEQLRQQKADEARRQQLEQQQKRQAEQTRRQQPVQQQAQQRQQIMKAPRNPTPGEIQKGFTGRVTADGRALVKFQNRILTVPAARISGLSAKLANDNQRKSNWTAQKQSAINSRIKAIAEGKNAGILSKKTNNSEGHGSDKNGGNNGQQERLLWTSWIAYPKVNEGGNEYAKIGNRLYTRHAVDRMQPSGLGAAAGVGNDKSPGRSFPPNLVEEVIRNGSQRTVTTINGVARTIHSSGTAEVVTEQEGKIVVTVNPFRGEK